jgi:hypothetical protein
MLYYRVMKENTHMAKKKHYKYIIETDKPLWPRKLADEVVNALGAHAISVTDLQNDGHIYGATYTVRAERSRRFRLANWVGAAAWL